MNPDDPTRDTDADMRSALEMTNALLAAVSTTDPVPALISRMAILCQGSAVIYDIEGGIVASAGEAPMQLIWNEVAASSQVEVHTEIGRWNVWTRRVSLRAGVHIIAVASLRDGTMNRLGDLLLDTSERLLSAVHGIQYAATLRDRRDNEQLFGVLHDGILPSREDRIWSRMTQFGFHAYTPTRILEMAPSDHGSADANDVAHLLDGARAHAIPLLAMLRRAETDTAATLSALLPDTPAAARMVDDLSRRYLIGASGAFSSLTHVPEGVREAETALRISRSWAGAADSPPQFGAVRMDHIDLSTWLLSHVDQRQLRARVEQTLAPVDSPPLRETLITFLANGQNVARTAELLYVHPNTVRYRLARIEEECGMSLASAPVLTNFTLALHPELASQFAGLGSQARS